MSKEADYAKLLGIFLRIGHAAKGTPAGKDDRILDAEGLGIKFLYHAASAFYLQKSTNLPEFKASFFDPASINVLGRAALETFLIFYYVFIEPKCEQQQDFRYNCWSYAGFLERQKFPVHSPQGKKKLSEEKAIVASLKARITSNRVFNKLTNRQQKNLLQRGEWRLSSWTKIALSAGLSEVHAKEFYHFLCGYAHAGNLSILQIRQARDAESQKTLCAATIGLIIIAMANMIKYYCSLFPRSNEEFLRSKEDVAFVDDWIQIGANSLDDIDVDWDKVNI